MSDSATNETPVTLHLSDVLASKAYRRLLALAAVVGLAVSVAAWAYLVLIHELEDLVWEDLPEAFGFDQTPAWWALPVLLLCGLLTGLAITRLPGHGGHTPANGFGGPPTLPHELPGVLLAALASLTLGASLGPEAPLIALGGALGILAVQRLTDTGASTPAASQASQLIAAAGTVAAISAIFGSPVVAAILVLEMLGLRGARLIMLMLPALLAAGVGGLVFTGIGRWTGLDIPALSTIPLEPFDRPNAAHVAYAVLIPAVVAIGLVAVSRAARLAVPFAIARPLTVAIAAGLAVGSMATLFAVLTDRDPTYVALSGQLVIGPLTSEAATWSVAALVILIMTKAIAYAASLAALRGGAIFPAVFLGEAVGVLVAPLPGLGIDAAVAIGVAAAAASMMRDLPLSASVLTLILCLSGGVALVPLIAIAVVVAVLVTELVDRRDAPLQPEGAG